MHAHSHNSVIIRLSALWAFTECALGGAMHALHIPFTGIVAGGFAIMNISLLAYFSNCDTRVILSSTLLVMMVKLAVSPQAPPPAFIAVAFQGVIGALLFRFIKPFAFAAFLFAVIAMLESALQKLLMVWIFFGNPLVEAINQFYAEVLKIFNQQPEISGSAWIIGAYLSIYLIWGVILGLWIPRLPNQLIVRAGVYDKLIPTSRNDVDVNKSNHRKRVILFALTLLFVTLVFLFTGDESTGWIKVMYSIFRTVSALLLWIMIAIPLFSLLIEKVLGKRKSKQATEFQIILLMLPEFSSRIRPLFKQVSSQYSGLRKFREWMIGLIIIALSIPLND